MDSKNFNVMDLANSYADSNDMSIDDLFKKSEEPEQVAEEETKETEEESGVLDPVRRKKGEWVPDQSLLEGMDEFSGPITYEQDEIKEGKNSDLVNNADEALVNSSQEQFSEMERIEYNLSIAKKRFGISKLKIPEGVFQVQAMNAASDTNHERAQKGLDEFFNMIINEHPEFIIEWDTTDSKHITTLAPGKDKVTGSDIINIPDGVEPHVNDESSEIDGTIDEERPDLQVIIDKTNLDQIAWSSEEADKIRRSRTVELDIVEGSQIEFSEIADAPDNMIVDSIISKYTRRNNDITASLPASRYRCTFTGLSYPEVIDLANSTEMTGLDAEKKKWSVCFDHVKNQSIGPWRRYKWYIDPNTKQKIEMDYHDTHIPDGLKQEDIHTVTYFDDFLMKTSFVDLDYMIWQILCATCMDKELITVDCHSELPAGGRCNHTYDWCYNPKELLRMDKINPAVLEEMKKTGEVSTKEDILNNYNEAFINKKNMVILPDCGLRVVFGHISAYDYLNDIYGKIQELQGIDDTDPSSMSKRFNYTTFTVVKEFIADYEFDGKKYMRINNTSKMMRIMNSLSEVDWQVVGELVNMTISPYNFEYSLRDIVCPKCKTKSSIVIEDMTQLLFIAARSLSNVHVTFKSN